MSNVDEEFAAHSLATAIANLRGIEAFSFTAAFDETMHVTWSRGSATDGYKELSKALSRVVAERWDELRADTVARAKARVETARAELLTAMGKSGG